LVTKNPNELAITIIVGRRCHVTESEVVEAVEGVFVRSGIKPTTELAKANGLFALAVSVNCLEAGGVFAVNADFANSIGGTLVRYGNGYGILGVADDDQYVLQVVKTGVENAAMDYLKANVHVAPK